jgi:hypothetical protein
VDAFRKLPRENNLNHESLSLLVRWLKDRQSKRSENTGPAARTELLASCNSSWSRSFDWRCLSGKEVTVEIDERPGAHRKTLRTEVSVGAHWKRSSWCTDQNGKGKPHWELWADVQNWTQARSEQLAWRTWAEVDLMRGLQTGRPRELEPQRARCGQETTGTRTGRENLARK